VVGYNLRIASSTNIFPFHALDLSAFCNKQCEPSVASFLPLIASSTLGICLLEAAHSLLAVESYYRMPMILFLTYLSGMECNTCLRSLFFSILINGYNNEHSRSLIAWSSTREHSKFK
jgi:hypothetical protein